MDTQMTAQFTVLQQGPRQQGDRVRAAVAWQRVLKLAEQQAAVVAKRQMARLGMSDGAIAWKKRAGELVSVHHGVCIIGGAPLTREAKWMAATLAAAEGTVLTGQAACANWGFISWTPKLIEVVAPQPYRGMADMIVRVDALRPREVTTHKGIPTAGRSRALIDLGCTQTKEQAARVMYNAEYRNSESHTFFDADEIRSIMADHPDCAAFEVIRSALEINGYDGQGSASTVEDEVIRLLTAAGITGWRVNVPVQTRSETLRVDVYFAAERLCLESDGFGHRRPRARRRDADRDVLLREAENRVLHFTDAMIQNHPDHFIQQVREVLAAAPAAPWTRSQV